jgi:hypothetical protein
MWTPGGQIDHITFAGMRKGGGGSNPYEQTTLVDPVSGEAFSSSPFSIQQGGKSASQQLNDEITTRKAKEQSDSDAAAAQKKADADKAESDFQQKKSDAYNSAMNDAINTFKNQGLDPNAYLANYINPALNKVQAGIQDLDPNPSGEYAANLGQTILDQATGDARSKALSQFNATFNPNYTATALPDSTMDPVIQQILGEQFDPVKQQLLNAEKRGTLTDQGYNAALTTLGQKQSAGSDTLKSLGANILSGDRTGINDLITGGRSDINNMTLGQQIDPNSYVTQAQGKIASDVSGFSGALRNALGGSQLVDITDLINAGGAAQGANNPTAANPTGLPGAQGGTPGLTPDQVQASQKRGLGSTGAF